jgi:4-hydroxy-4-methyl-2-oxoglutarate aldolase
MRHPIRLLPAAPAIVIALGMLVAPASGQVAAPSGRDAELRSGRNFIATPVTTAEQDAAVLKLFEGLRVADVTDGMDKAGLQNIGLVSPDIHPLWRDTQHFTHRIVGIAVTARYVPTNKPPIGRMETGQFNRHVGQWYKSLSPEPFVPLLRQGSALVIEDALDADIGTIGSNNILGWKQRGCVGVVTSAAARDTDEITTERMPLYFMKPGRGIRPGRNELESVNRPVVVGGVQVVPGDVIVADGDGVVVVPRQQAEEVARYAREILEGDKAARRKLYEKVGLPSDDSIK